jgi:rsbT co-antagonist protein RsbR
MTTSTASFQEQVETLTRERALFAQLLASFPSAFILWQLEQPDDPTSFRLVMANGAAGANAQVDLASRCGQRMEAIFPQVTVEQMQVYADALRSGRQTDLGEMSFPEPDGSFSYYDLQLVPLLDNHLCIIHTDVTQRKRAETMLRESMAQDEMIRAQQAVLAELSTPLIPINDEVMVMPLVGSIDSRRAQQVMDALLEGIAQTRARVAILDITGVPVVDTQVANALIRAAQSVRLLGAQVILTGIRPEVAQTLVGLGADLSGITTRSSLQSGIACATQRLAA